VYAWRISLYHRVGLVVGEGPLPDDAWGNPPSTPRAELISTPGWGLLGDPARIVCRVSFHHSRSEEVIGRTRVSLDNLGLDPLDFWR
jgi:hypothetical protein